MTYLSQTVLLLLSLILDTEVALSLCRFFGFNSSTTQISTCLVIGTIVAFGIVFVSERVDWLQNGSIAFDSRPSSPFHYVFPWKSFCSAAVETSLFIGFWAALLLAGVTVYIACDHFSITAQLRVCIGTAPFAFLIAKLFYRGLPKKFSMRTLVPDMVSSYIRLAIAVDFMLQPRPFVNGMRLMSAISAVSGTTSELPAPVATWQSQYSE
jgi:hypothetical protein